MATPQEKLAASLESLRHLQSAGRNVFQTAHLTRTHRERLREAGFLTDIIRGWMATGSPDDPGRGSTSWYSHYWEFCARYAEARFGSDWWLSPAASLCLHGEDWRIPSQLVVQSPAASNNSVELPGGTSLFDLKTNEPRLSELAVIEHGLRVYRRDAALARAPAAYFRTHSVEVQTVLASISDFTGLLRLLLEGGRVAAAGRLGGALRAMGRGDDARKVTETLRAAQFDVREENPFTSPPSIKISPHPIDGRVRALWQEGRGAVVDTLPRVSGSQGRGIDDVLSEVEDRYTADAYHSLSIEGYRVSPELIEKVRSGDWDPDSGRDRADRDAMAARGYWMAFQQVRDSLRRVLAGGDCGEILRRDHGAWYQALFQPSVTAGILPASALAGYRDGPVYISGSRHVPPRHPAVVSGMDALFSCLAKEPDLAVAAVLVHWLTGYIHPYADGNGRMARFAMNVLLVVAGHPWTVIPVEDRSEYLRALEAASIDRDLAPLARLIARLLGGQPA